MEEIVFADVESNGLLRELTLLWCLSIAGPKGEPDIYADQPGYRPLSEGIARLRRAKKVVFHNGLGFDFWAINRLYQDVFDLDRIIDTLVISRLVNPERLGGHSLEAWGKHLGFEKGEWSDWSRFDPEMATYCQQDVRVLRRIYFSLQEEMKDHDWSQAVDLEHRVAYVIALQEQHGFRLDVGRAVALAADLRQEADDLTRQLQEVFPPIVHERWSEKTGKRLKDKIEVFNPGSRQQIARRLMSLGWRPEKFTPSGAPQIDDAVLAELPYPEAKPLARYFRCSKQLGQIADGDNGWLKLEKNGRVYGKVNPNGAVTGRMTHFTPNMAQIDKKDLRMREVWTADEGEALVGCDAEGLELRMLAHYLARYDRGLYATAVVSGSKDDKSDVHSRTQIIAALFKRDNAKTLMYAYLYGAGDLKLGKIILEDATEAGQPAPQPSREAYLEAKKRVCRKAQRDGRKPSTEEIILTALGVEAREKLQRGITGLDKLVDAVKKAHKQQKYVRGLDGRKIFTRSDHSSLNTLLQGAGAVVMKKALEIFHFDLAVSHLRYISYCANVHDEVQMSVLPEHAESVGKLFAQSIAEAGVRLGIRCPLAGKYDIGHNWKDTH